MRLSRPRRRDKLPACLAGCAAAGPECKRTCTECKNNSVVACICRNQAANAPPFSGVFAAAGQSARGAAEAAHRAAAGRASGGARQGEQRAAGRRPQRHPDRHARRAGGAGAGAAAGGQPGAARGAERRPVACLAHARRCLCPTVGPQPAHAGALVRGRGWMQDSQTT